MYLRPIPEKLHVFETNSRETSMYLRPIPEKLHVFESNSRETDKLLFMDL